MVVVEVVCVCVRACMLTRHSRENGVLFAHTLKYAQELVKSPGDNSTRRCVPDHVEVCFFNQIRLIDDKSQPRKHRFQF